MTKILVILDENFPPDVRVERELKTLSENHTVHLLCYTTKNQPETEQYNEFKVFRINISPLMYKLKALALLLPFYFKFWRNAIKKQFTEHKYDLIHLHDLTLARPVRVLATKYKIPYILDLHENRPEIMPFYPHMQRLTSKILISVNTWKRYQKKEVTKANALILVTKEAVEYYNTNYATNTQKTFAVPNFIDPVEYKKFNAETTHRSNKFRVVYFGDTELRRGTGMVIEAAKRFPETEFIIIGDSKYDQPLLQNMAKELDNVTLTGYLPVPKAMAIISGCDLGVSPLSRNIHHDTTYANKLFQYMFYELALLVSDCPAQANIVKESANGCIHKGDDLQDFCAKIEEAVNFGEIALLKSRSKKAVKEK